jgi:hypothetical protein
MSQGHPNPDGALSSGIYCTVELLIPRKKDAIGDETSDARGSRRSAVRLQQCCRADLHHG